MPRFSIYQGSEYGFCSVYTRVLNMPGIQRVLKMPILCLCLNMSEYARICVNIPSSAWLAFVLNFFIVISLGCFLEETKIDFSWSSWEYLICFLSKTKYFCKQNFKFVVTFADRRPWGSNLDTDNLSMMAFNDLCTYFFCCCCFCCRVSSFWCFRGLNQKLAKAVIL